MHRLPLFRFGARARSTSWGIALCTMFIVASFSVAGGLDTSMEKLSKTFDTEYYIITKAENSALGFFSGNELSGLSARCAFGTVSDAVLQPYGTYVTVFSVSDESGILPGLPDPADGDVYEGSATHPLGNATLVAAASVNITIEGAYSHPVFPDHWMIGSQELLGALVGQSGKYNFAIGRSLTESELAAVEAEGFQAQGMIGIVDFLDSGIEEIRSDATWVLLPSVFVIAVLAYSFLGAEMADRRHDIGILKTIGAGRSRLLSYLLGNALLISAWGGLLGVALGIVLSYGISTSASTAFTSVFVMGIDEMLVIGAYLATLGAALIGALIPAVRMTYSTPVKDLKEVALSD